MVGLRKFALRRKGFDFKDDESDYATYHSKSERPRASSPGAKPEDASDGESFEEEENHAAVDSTQKRKRLMGIPLPSVSLRSKKSSSGRGKKKMSSNGIVRVAETLASFPAADQNSSIMEEQRENEEDQREDIDAREVFDERGNNTSPESKTESNFEIVENDQDTIRQKNGETGYPPHDNDPGMQGISPILSYDGPSPLQNMTLEEVESHDSRDKYAMDLDRDDATLELENLLQLEDQDWVEKTFMNKKVDKVLKDPIFAQVEEDLHVPIPVNPGKRLLSAFDYCVWATCNIEFDDDEDDDEDETTLMSAREIAFLGTNETMSSLGSMGDSPSVEGAAQKKTAAKKVSVTATGELPPGRPGEVAVIPP